MPDEIRPSGWKPGQLSFWDEAYKLYGKTYPNDKFWSVLRQLYPTQTGDTGNPYFRATLKDLYMRFQNGQLTVPTTTPTAPTTPTTVGGFTPEAWGYGLPEYQLALRRQQLAEEQWAAEQAGAGAKLSAQEAQNALQRWYQEREMQRIWAEADVARQNRMAAQLQAGMGQTDEQREANLQQQEQALLARKWNITRDQILSAISGQPNQWVTEYQLRNQPNPYVTQPPSTMETVGQEQSALRQDYKNLQEIIKMGKDTTPGSTAYQLAQNAQTAFSTVRDRLNEANIIIGIAQNRDWAKAQADKISGFWGNKQDVIEQAQWAQPRGNEAGGYTVGAGGGGEGNIPKPTIPAEIQSYLQKPEFGAPVVTPSMQQWNIMPWSTTEKLRGYSEASFGKPSWQELLDRMTMARPEPAQRVGRYTPYRRF